MRVINSAPFAVFQGNFMTAFVRPSQCSAPRLAAPTGTIDTHMHIISDGFAQSPVLPPHALASIEDYAEIQNQLGIRRAVVVQPNIYQFDNSCLEQALTTLGANARGVAVVKPDVEEKELERLHAIGVRGARIMDIGPGAVSSADMIDVNARISPLGWHPIIQFNGRDIADYTGLLSQVSGNYVIDHAGKFMPPVTPDSAEFSTLLKLVDRGNCYVKLSACYETSQTGAPEYRDVGALSAALAAHAPDRMLWASNWPHVSATGQTYPDDGVLLDLLLQWVPEEFDRKKILEDNAVFLYGF
jgi:D-galactarolactone isomerase